jgi:prepilin-type N-terminal cleavage/methylation domain-containing protein
MQRRGFTIAELLIVIVVVAILAAITVAVYNGARIRAQASQISTDLKAIEKALNLYKHSIGLATWPNDDDASYFTGLANPSVSSIIAARPELRSFLSAAPVAANIGSSSAYALDSDGDTYNGCSAITSGVNIFVANATNTELMQAVDTMIDDDNLSCGRIRVGGTSFHYNIARSASS